jgi:HAD superfamily hydrolase (TIGR01450 family)
MTRVHADIASKGTWVIDLDGVIWLADDPIPGSAAAVARLRARGLAVVFATNNASPTIAELRTRLADAGIETEPDELVTSAQAAASILEPGSTAVVCADGGVLEALAARGVTVVGEGPADAVVVGWTRQFDFDLLATAATAVRMGARFVGTNEDPTHPTPGRLLPGSGAILAAVATAAQATPEVAGKPHAPLVALLRARRRHHGRRPTLHRRCSGPTARHPLRIGAHRRDLRRPRADGRRARRGGSRPPVARDPPL